MSDDPSLLDPLTGLHNRAAFLSLLRLRMAPGRGALVLIDLDRWREVSGRLAKPRADAVLTAVAGRLRTVAGEGAPLCRWGLDAFALLLPDADRDRGAATAEALRAAVASPPFELPAGPEGEAVSVGLTVSGASAEYPIDGRTAALLVETAELALLVAKNRGRDRVAVAGRLDAGALAEIGVFRGLPCPVLVGRVDEQTRLRQAAADVRHVGPRLALIDGAPGSGKSRLLRELAVWARSERFVVLAGVAHEARGGAPYGVLSDLLENLLVADRSAALDALRRLPDDQRSALAVSVRGFPEELAARGLEVADFGKTIFDAWGALLDRLAEAGPLFLVVDEAEHADAATLEVVGAAVARRLPFFFVAATALEPKGLSSTAAGEFLRGRGTALVRATLGPLPAEEMAKMLSAILPGAEVDPAGGKALLEAAKGSPLQLEETLRSLLLRNRIRLEEGRWRVPALEIRELPEDLDSAIRAVAGALPGRANAMLARAAALGPQVDPEVLEEVMGQDETEMLDLLDEARRARLLTSSDIGTDILAFPAAHARKVRLEAAEESERQEIHRRVGVVQEARHGGDLAAIADELAYHYGRGGEKDRADRFGEVARKRAALLRPAAPEAARRARLEPVTQALSAPALEHAAAAFRFFAAALRVGRLYPKASHVSAGFVDQLRGSLRSALEGGPGLSIAVGPKGPTVNGAPTELPAAVEFAALLEERLVESVTFLPAFDPARAADLLEAFAEPFTPATAAADHWDRFLGRKEIPGLDIVQKAFQAREGDRGRGRVLAEEAVPPEAMPALREAIRALKGAAENVRLYPPGHILVEETAALAERHCLDFLARVPVVTLGAAEGDLVVNGHPGDLKFMGDAGAYLVREIGTRGLWSLTLERGLTRDELRSLVGLLASAPGTTLSEAAMKALPHVRFGAFRYERAETVGAEEILAPPPKPIRSELRAREILERAYPAFLTDELEEAFPALVEALAYGARRALAEQLVDRLGEHFHDGDLKHRRRALDLLARCLAFASPSCRRVEVERSTPPLRTRLSEDDAPAAFRASTDILPIWFPAAATSGCLRELADLAGPVLRRRADSPGTPAEVKAAAESVLQLIPNTAAYPVVIAALRRPKPEDRALALEILKAVGGAAHRKLAELVVDEPDPALRQSLAQTLSGLREDLEAELVRMLGPQGSPERLARSADVVGLFAGPKLTTVLAETVESGSPAARGALLGAADRLPRPVVLAAARRLLASADPARREEGIDLATRQQLEPLGGELRRMLEEAHDEALIRKLCRYLMAVPSPAALPALLKVVSARPRFFGIVRGYSAETRAEAIRVLARLQVREADEALAAAAGEKRLRALLRDLIEGRSKRPA